MRWCYSFMVTKADVHDKYIKDYKKDAFDKLTNDEGLIDGKHLVQLDRPAIIDVVDLFNDNLVEKREEVEYLKNELNRGIIMDEKDLELFRRDMDASFEKRMKDLSSDIGKKISDMNSKLSGLEANSIQSCKDGECTNNVLSSMNEMIGALDKKILEINKSSMINDLNEKIDSNIGALGEKVNKVCEGVDCLTKRFEEEDNTVMCPSCKSYFIWDDSVTHCPNCGISLEAE